MKALFVRVACLGFHAEQDLLSAFELGAVKRLLFAFHFAEQILLDAIGQILGDLAFGATQQEGTHSRGQRRPGERIIFGIEATCELRAVAEHARHGKGDNAPEIEQPILDGRAGERQAMVGLQRARGLRGLRIGILDVLALRRESPPASARS